MFFEPIMPVFDVTHKPDVDEVVNLVFSFITEDVVLRLAIYDELIDQVVCIL